MNRRLQWIQYTGFITLGFVSSILSPVISSIRADISMTYLEAGMILSGQFLGILISVPFGGFLADRFGKKQFLIAGGIALIIGLTGCMLSYSFPALFFFCIITGIGNCSYEIGINAMLADYTESESGKAMNYLHFFFGFGAIIAPALATILLKTVNSWRLTFAITIILPVLFSTLLISQPVKRVIPENKNGKLGSIYLNPLLWIFGFAMAAYVGIETSVYSWIPIYWGSVSGFALIPASITASFFWITLTVGRLISGRITDKIGLTRFVLVSSIAVLLVCLCWSIVPGNIVTLLSVFLLGFLLAGIFPTIMAYITAKFPGNSGKTVAFLMIFSSIGGFFLPSLLGRLADSFSLRIFPVFLTILALIMIGFTASGALYGSKKK